MHPSIANLDVYNARMRKALLDKAWFLDKVEAETFIDYGCADGTLIYFMNWMFPEHRYVGYDISEGMLDLARKVAPQAYFTSDITVLRNLLKKLPGPSCLILSSVIHEVVAYGGADGLPNMWQDVLRIDAEHVVIRDMMFGARSQGWAKDADVIRILDKADRTIVTSFEKVWGTIDDRRAFLHFLLKYRYTDNWECENNENYFPMTLEQFVGTIPKEYQITEIDHYTLPFLKRQVKHDFDITLTDPTHVKIILERA